MQHSTNLGTVAFPRDLGIAMVRGLGGLSQPGVSPLRTWSWATLFKEGKPGVVCRAHSGYRSPVLPQLVDLCGSGHISESPQLSFLSPASSTGMFFVVSQEHLSLLRQDFSLLVGIFFLNLFFLCREPEGCRGTPSSCPPTPSLQQGSANCTGGHQGLQPWEPKQPSCK